MSSEQLVSASRSAQELAALRRRITPGFPIFAAPASSSRHRTHVGRGRTITPALPVALSLLFRQAGPFLAHSSIGILCRGLSIGCLLWSVGPSGYKY